MKSYYEYGMEKVAFLPLAAPAIPYVATAGTAFMYALMADDLLKPFYKPLMDSLYKKWFSPTPKPANVPSKGTNLQSTPPTPIMSRGVRDHDAGTNNGPGVYRRNHVPGAWSMTGEEFYSKIPGYFSSNESPTSGKPNSKAGGAPNATPSPQASGAGSPLSGPSGNPNSKAGGAPNTTPSPQTSGAGAPPSGFSGKRSGYVNFQHSPAPQGAEPGGLWGMVNTPEGKRKVYMTPSALKSPIVHRDANGVERAMSSNDYAKMYHEKYGPPMQPQQEEPRYNYGTWAGGAPRNPKVREAIRKGTKIFRPSAVEGNR